MSLQQLTVPKVAPGSLSQPKFRRPAERLGGIPDRAPKSNGDCDFEGLLLKPHDCLKQPLRRRLEETSQT
jgi:hypothetical protein